MTLPTNGGEHINGANGPLLIEPPTLKTYWVDEVVFASTWETYDASIFILLLAAGRISMFHQKIPAIPRIWVCSENGGPQHHSFSLGKPLALGYPVGKPPFFWVHHASASAIRRNAKHLRKSWTRLHGPRAANADPSCLTQPCGT